MKAVIFDMDGVIVDSEGLWRQAERAVFAEVGLALSDADCEKTMGMRSDEVIAYWYGQEPWAGASIEEVETRLTHLMLTLISEKAIAMAGAEHAISIAQRAGHQLGLASSSCPDLINAVLVKLGLENTFRVACSAINEKFGKPHPAVFLTAARKLGVQPELCVAIEDSAAGVRAALDASMRVIAVPPPHLFDDPAYDGAHTKLRSLQDFALELLF